MLCLLITVIKKNEIKQTFEISTNLRITVADPCRNRNGDCEHKCINNNGNRLCECYAGYKLSSDQRHCEGKLPFNPEGKLPFDLEGKLPEVIVLFPG